MTAGISAMSCNTKCKGLALGVGLSGLGKWKAFGRATYVKGVAC